MDKRYSQLELFSQEQPAAAPEGARRPSFLLQVNRYEKSIFLMIGFIVTAAAFYCLGMERGKSLAVRRLSTGLDLALKNPQSPRRQPAAELLKAPEASAAAAVVSVAHKAAPVPRPQPVVRAAISPSEVNGKKGLFTIQIGTYQARTSAEREKNKLVRKGLAPVMVKKGAYTVLCVGNFNTKETARSLLSKLRQNYRDCYIRRL